MKITKFENRESWLSSRLGRISGTRLKDIIVKRGTGKKIGFYELIAERLGIPADSEPPMERGVRLQGEAMEIFEKEIGKKINTDLVLWQRDDNESIAISPDGSIGKTEAIEVKCLASSRHIEVLLTGKIPDDYEYQVLQYFIVNEKLQKLYFCFYDPRILVKPFFFIEVIRENMEEKIKEILEYQENILKEVDTAVLQLSNF